MFTAQRVRKALLRMCEERERGREENERQGRVKVGRTSEEGRGGEGEIPLARPHFPRSNKWRMETETGAQNMVGGREGGRGAQP